MFVLNNSGYLIERLLCKNPAIEYNDLAPRNYVQLLAALACDNWYTTRVTTGAELDDALAAAETAPHGAYIEVVTATYAVSPLAEQLGASLRRCANGTEFWGWHSLQRGCPGSGIGHL